MLRLFTSFSNTRFSLINAQEHRKKKKITEIEYNIYILQFIEI